MPVIRYICFPMCLIWLLVFKACVGSCGGGVAIGCVGGKNRILTFCKASLISFGEALNLIINSCEDRICWVVGF